MTELSFFRIDSNRFAHETVDDEVILIDMDEGNYFSMRESAAAIWQLLEQGRSSTEIVSELERATGVDSRQIQPEVNALLDQLIKERIVCLEPGSNQQDSDQIAISITEYSTPKLEKFTEMQDLLTLDPIHEVDETGWPNKSENES
jgi:hypothetical protein